MMFGIVIYEFTGDGMMTPGQHSAVRSLFGVPFGVEFCGLEVMPGCLFMMRCRLGMIVNAFFVVHVFLFISFKAIWGAMFVKLNTLSG
jgi:hypothetical protein